MKPQMDVVRMPGEACLKINSRILIDAPRHRKSHQNIAALDGAALSAVHRPELP